MNLEPNNLLASLLVGSVGFVAFAYGKKQSRWPQLGIGLVLMIFPYFVASVPLMLGIAAGLIALLVVAVKVGF